MHILVVDSDPIQIQSLTRGLKGKGFFVSTATSKSEAFAVLDIVGADIGLILIDSKVPQLDPFEMVSRTRASQNMFPVIIMTTYISKELQNKIEHDASLALIEKPFVLDTLVQEIAKFHLYQT